MPRNVRNFWIELTINGATSRDRVSAASVWVCQNYGCEPPLVPHSHLLGNYARGGDNRALCGVIITLPDTLARSGEPTCPECAVINEEDAVHLLSLRASDAPGMSPRMVRRIAQVRIQLREARKGHEN